MNNLQLPEFPVELRSTFQTLLPLVEHVVASRVMFSHLPRVTIYLMFVTVLSERLSTSNLNTPLMYFGECKNIHKFWIEHAKEIMKSHQSEDIRLIEAAIIEYLATKILCLLMETRNQNTQSICISS